MSGALAFVDDEPLRYMIRLSPWRSSASTDYAPPPAPQSATTNQQSEPLWYRPSMERLSDLLALPPGWDGSGSVSPNISVAAIALKVLSSIAKPMTPPPTIAPVPDGRLQLVWYAAGLELEITVDDKGQIDIGLFDLSTGVDEEGVTLSDPRLAEAISRLSAM